MVRAGGWLHTRSARSHYNRVPSMANLRRTEHGLVTISDPGSDKPILEAGTLRCCHCGQHWVPKPGSGRVRGWCMNHAAPVCGPGCAECVDVEQLLENIERGRPLDFRPVVVSVSFDPER